MSKKNDFVVKYVALKSNSAFKDAKRGEVVAELSKEVGISVACASTYLSNVASGKWKLDGSDVKERAVKAPKTPKAPRAKKNAMTAEAIAAMDTKTLVATYNGKAEKPVKKFANREAGIKRVMGLFGMKA
jgi:hypothetical protein